MNMENKGKKYYYYDLEKILPEDIFSRAIALSSLHIKESAWGWEDAMTVIEYLTKAGIFVLGGEVYRLHNDKILPAYDGWHVDISAYIPTSEDLENSRRIGIAYIKKYVSRNGKEFLFSIVHYIPGL